jgi:hypothetical protein
MLGQREPIKKAENMTSKVLTVVWCTMLILLFVAGIVLGDNYKATRQVISSGGTDGTSTNFKVNASAAQLAAGFGTSASFQVDQGYWPGLASTYLCGDASGDATVNISDAVYLIAYIFAGGSAPNPLLSGDANCDSAVNISDAVYLIAYIFAGGPAPCAGC